MPPNFWLKLMFACYLTQTLTTNVWWQKLGYSLAPKSKIKMTKIVTDFSTRNLKLHHRTDTNWEQENTVNWYRYFCFSRSVQICMEVTWSLTTPMMKQKVRYISHYHNILLQNYLLIHILEFKHSSWIQKKIPPQKIIQ